MGCRSWFEAELGRGGLLGASGGGGRDRCKQDVPGIYTPRRAEAAWGQELTLYLGGGR